jgi:hypothetical protein
VIAPVIPIAKPTPGLEQAGPAVDVLAVDKP